MFLGPDVLGSVDLLSDGCRPDEYVPRLDSSFLLSLPNTLLFACSIMFCYVCFLSD
jgi:hypothetical protein